MDNALSSVSQMDCPMTCVQSLYQDDRGRIWVFTGHGLAGFQDGKFVAVQGVPSEQVYSIDGGQGGQPLAFRERGSLAHAGRTFGRAFPLVRAGTSTGQVLRL